MSYKSVLAMLSLAIVAFFSTLALAQQQDSPAPGKSAPMDHGQMGKGQMSHGMMGGQMMMGQMMAQHQEMSELMSKMMQSMTAINSEKDPAKLKALLAEHAALMDQMHAKMMSQGNMMHDMAGQMKNCPAMGDTSK
jgi:hypothetical protein